MCVYTYYIHVDWSTNNNPNALFYKVKQKQTFPNIMHHFEQHTLAKTTSLLLNLHLFARGSFTTFRHGALIFLLVE